MNLPFWRNTDATSPSAETALDADTRMDAGAPANWVLRSWTPNDDSVHEQTITSVPFRVGRLSENDLTIPDPTVSSRHAELFFVMDDLFVRDLNSTNGTFVNGRKIRDVEALHAGDLLQLGNFKLHVVRQAQASSQKTLSVDIASQVMAHVQFNKLINEVAVTPHLQPIIRLSDTEIVGFEVLGRSRLPGLETPADMFRVAAERRLEARLSEVLREEGLRCGRQLGQSVPLYVNTHPRELNDYRLFDSLTSLRTENPDTRIMLEVHEAAVTSTRFLTELRERLNDLQIGLAYDDFGAGQARLIELCDVPPDVIKFDLQLIQGLWNGSSERLRIVSTLVRMVLDLGVVPLAEGVELQADADACRELGFELAQGFLFGRPAPVEDWVSASTDSDP